jgi:cytochrome c2
MGTTVIDSIGRKAARVALTFAVCSLPWAVAVGWRAGTPAQAPPPRPASPDPIFAADMRGHFVGALRVADAVIRGDLRAVRETASTLGGQSFDRVPPLDGRYVGEMRSAAARAATAPDVVTAAAAAASMVATCGDCHRGANVRAAFGDPLMPPDVGGIVGHMKGHQAAVDLLARGLIAPSASTWEAGAAALAGASLKTSAMPPDRQLRREMVDAERRAHALGAQARAATTPTARATVFAEVLATCASCHGKHPGIWGPSRR